jgi:hypothetical protein
VARELGLSEQVLHGLETNTEHDRADGQHDNRRRSEGGDNQASDSDGQPNAKRRDEQAPVKEHAHALHGKSAHDSHEAERANQRQENPKHREQQFAVKHAKVLLREIGDAHEAFQSGVLPLDESQWKASPLCDQGVHSVVLSVQSAQLA